MVTTLANRLYNTMIAIITAYVPSHTCARIWALGPTPSAPKQWKSDVQVES